MKKGFSLVELSIVIIIIGLLFVGVSAGSSLIQQAKIRTIFSDISQIQRSVQTFKVAYDYLPGDFPGAGILWGSACGGNSPASSGCNGDGDGVVGNYGETTAAPNWSAYQTKESTTETFRFWQHMQLAEIMDRSFTGEPSASDCLSVSTPTCFTDENSYQLKYKDGILVNILDARKADYYINTYGYNYFSFKSGGVEERQSSFPEFTARDTYNIDKKLDDGGPRSGRMQTLAPAGTGETFESCYETRTGGVYLYNIETNGRCIFYLHGSFLGIL